MGAITVKQFDAVAAKRLHIHPDWIEWKASPRKKKSGEHIRFIPGKRTRAKKNLYRQNETAGEFAVSYLKLRLGFTDSMIERFPDSMKTIYTGGYETRDGYKTFEILTIDFSKRSCMYQNKPINKLYQKY